MTWRVPKYAIRSTQMLMRHCHRNCLEIRPIPPTHSANNHQLSLLSCCMQITQELRVPCAHAPALHGLLPAEASVSPKACAEELGYTFLPCVLANLHRAPRLVLRDDPKAHEVFLRSIFKLELLNLSTLTNSYDVCTRTIHHGV